jgi:DNA recombination protein RmuC
VKTEFGKFGDLLEKTKKKILEAGDTIDSATTKTRTIQSKLRRVEALPESAVGALLPEAPADEGEADGGEAGQA